MSGRQKGFTLVEMLVALMVAGLLISLTYGSVVVGQRSARLLYDQVENTDVMLIGWQFLQRAISQARPVVNPEDSKDRTTFYGKAHELSLVASLPAYVGPGGLTQITLKLVPKDDKTSLVITRAPYPLQTPETDSSSVNSAELLDDVESLQISYLGKTGDEAFAWHDQWTDPEHLPNLVRIAIKPTQGPPWPVLMVSPLNGTAPIPRSDGGLLEFDDNAT